VYPDVGYGATPKIRKNQETRTSQDDNRSGRTITATPSVRRVVQAAV